MEKRGVLCWPILSISRGRNTFVPIESFVEPNLREECRRIPNVDWGSVEWVKLRVASTMLSLFERHPIQYQNTIQNVFSVFNVCLMCV
jgi:hypothetical protein